MPIVSRTLLEVAVVRALVRTAHPGPSLLITAVIVALAVRVGLGARDAVIFAVGTFAGEAFIGWSNDAFDAARDAAGGRTDKPIVTGEVSRRVVAIAAAVALVVAVVLCFVLGPATGVINLVMLGAGFAYNLGLKGTLASGLMFVVGFGLIPAFAASTLPGQPWPPTWTLVASAMLGLGSHFANVLPDLAADRAASVKGLPQVVAAGPGGAAAVRAVALVLLVGASALIVFAPPGPPGVVGLLALFVAVGLAVGGAFARGRRPFQAALAIAALDVALFVGVGTVLVP
jgi:4-hydroxybenzoate polyprenyltransferase